MTCKKFIEMLDNYESITDEEKALMSEHASQCEECGRELSFMRSVINSVKTLPKMKVPEDFLVNLNKRIDAEESRAAQRRKATPRIWYSWQKYSAVAACLVIVAIIGANYDMFTERMDGGGIISEVTTVSTPAPGMENKAALPRSTAAADNKAAADRTDAPRSTARPPIEENHANANSNKSTAPSGTSGGSTVSRAQSAGGLSRSDSSGSAGSAGSTGSAGSIGSAGSSTGSTASRGRIISSGGASGAVPSSSGASVRSEASGSSSSASSSQASENRGASENVVTSEPEDSQTTAPADEENEQTRPAAEENPESTSDVRTVTLPRGVYVESHGEDDEAAQETSEPENADNPYAISAVSETDGYAMTEGDNTSDDYPDNGGGGDEPDYELNQRNMIVVRGEDFAAAFDIICQYASESYSNYFMVTSDNIDIMLAALDDAGVQYHDNIAVDTDKITFRISIG